MAAAVKVTRTLHHSVNVEGDLEANVAFYEGLLELPSDARPEIPGVGGHWFAAGNAQLHLVDADPGPPGIQPTGPHVCFAVADLDAAIAELEAAAVPYARGAQGTTVQIWFTDPAGNTVEIQQDPDVLSGA
jgi:catechol 2,3-dioxygenase-like lactoylglutathione lyase family enzyme